MKKLVALPDTNYILRYLLQDDDAQFNEANVFFEQVRIGKERAVVLESVITECLYVLVRHYKTPRVAAAESLLGLLAYKGMVNPDKVRIITALNIFIDSKLDPVDCLLAATLRHEQYTLRTFDKALLKLAK